MEQKSKTGKVKILRTKILATYNRSKKKMNGKMSENDVTAEMVENIRHR